MVRSVPFRLRISKIVWACRDGRVMHKLSEEIRRRQEEAGGIIKPVVVIDAVPDVSEQMVASMFLDLFASVPDRRLCRPEFVYEDGIEARDLWMFFSEYERRLKTFYSRFFRFVECG